MPYATAARRWWSRTVTYLRGASSSMVDEADFPRQRRAAFGPERMRHERFERHAFAGLQHHFRAGLQIQHRHVLEHAETLFQRRARAIDLEQLHHEARAAPVHDVLGLDDVIMMRRALAVLGQHRLFRVEPSAALDWLAPVAHSQREHAQAGAGEISGLELDDVPTQSAVENALRGGGIGAVMRLAP
jgi:hypothetical protein